MNEMNAIAFLRAAISSEVGVLDDGRLQPGWCCTEHAVIASLAFAICNVDAYLCDGMAFIGPTNDGLILDVLPHSFVAIGKPIRGVFDSSITFGRILGLPMRYATYENLGVGYMERKPTKEEFLMEYHSSKSEVFAMYSARTMGAPNLSTLRWISSTPFGEWLTERYSSQRGIWGKAAWITAKYLRGAVTFDGPQVTKEAIWDEIVRSPNRDDAIYAILA